MITNWEERCYWWNGIAGFELRSECPCEVCKAIADGACLYALGVEGVWSCEDCTCASCRLACLDVEPYFVSYVSDSLILEDYDSMVARFDAEDKEVANLISEEYTDRIEALWDAVGDKLAGHRTVGYSV
jgi:hypothetical protein